MRLLLFCQQGDFFERPDVIGHPRFHCRGNTKALVNAGEIVMHQVDCYRSGVVLNLLAGLDRAGDGLRA